MRNIIITSTFISLTILGCSLESKFQSKMELSSVEPQASEELSDYRPKAFRRASLIYLNRAPSLSEIEKASTQIGYESLIKNLVESNDFVKALMQHHKSHFNMSGIVEGVNYNEPANLAAYLINEDLDYRGVLQANFCVDDELNVIECSSFSKDPNMAKKYGAGVVTSQAFLKKWSGPFNFLRTSKMFEVFSCQKYPDYSDVGVSIDSISNSAHTFSCIDCNPSCFSCHSTMNPRATLFYKFDINGQFNLQPNDSERVKTDTGELSKIEDLLLPGSVALFKGKEMESLREYAFEFSRSQEFKRCLAKRLISFSIGAGLEDKLEFKFEQLVQNLELRGFVIRDFIYDLLISEDYVRN